MKWFKNVFLGFLFFFELPVYAAEYGDISLGKTLLQLFFYIIVFVAVIFMTLYGTKLIAKNSKRFTKSKYIQVLDAFNIQTGVKLAIVKINKKVYILSISNASTTIIDIISSDDLDNEFDNYLNKYINNGENLNFKLNIDKLKDKLKFSKDKEEKNEEEF